MTQFFKMLAVFPKDPSSGPSTHLGPQLSITPPPGHQILSSILHAPAVSKTHIQTYNFLKGKLSLETVEKKPWLFSSKNVARMTG